MQEDVLEPMSNHLFGQMNSTQLYIAYGFPQSPELTKRELTITQGTINCALAALKTSIALNVAGGTHHAFSDHGEGSSRPIVIPSGWQNNYMS